MALANQVFGEGYFRAKAAIGKESGSLLLLWRGSEGRLAGFVQGRRLPKDALRRLLDHRIADLPSDIDAADAADKLIVTFKRGTSAANVDMLMSTLGFKLWASLPSFWAHQCDQGDFKCVDRDELCRCEALLCTKAVF